MKFSRYNLFEEYAVEKILERKQSNKVYYYLIKWKGYPMNDSTWEPEIKLNKLQRHSRKL